VASVNDEFRARLFFQHETGAAAMDTMVDRLIEMRDMIRKRQRELQPVGHAVGN